MSKEHKGPKILVLDIETSPIISYTWGLFDQNVGLNQIKTDWNVLSIAAKWYEGPDGKVYGPHNKIMYKDLSQKKDKTDDKELLQWAWNLLDGGDILLSQNGVKFDNKKLNARFVLNGIKPPSSFKHIDTLRIAKKYFAFTSNKLEYMSDKLCVKYKKQTKREFSGFDLWRECLANNKKAWAEMKKYNCYDVLALEELYQILSPWDNSIDFNLYNDSLEVYCKCGSTEFGKNGYAYTSVGKFQRFTCKKCGNEARSRKNLIDKDKKETIKTATARNSG